MIADRIRAAGFEVHHQVGCSGYRIDLAVVDPTAPDRYLLGIECDGATYHRATTARDRDKLRQMILEDLGWKVSVVRSAMRMGLLRSLCSSHIGGIYDRYDLRLRRECFFCCELSLPCASWRVSDRPRRWLSWRGDG